MSISDAIDGYLKAEQWLDITGSTRDVRVPINANRGFSEGSDGFSLQEMIENPACIIWDVGGLKIMMILAKNVVDFGLNM